MLIMLKRTMLQCVDVRAPTEKPHNTYAKSTSGLQRTLDVHLLIHNFVRKRRTTWEVPAVAMGVLRAPLSLKYIFKNATNFIMFNKIKGYSILSKAHHEQSKPSPLSDLRLTAMRYAPLRAVHLHIISQQKGKNIPLLR